MVVTPMARPVVPRLLRWPAVRYGLALLACGLASVAQARVVRVVVERQTPLVSADAPFAYETLRGRAFGELDPDDPANALITDLKLAPRNAEGRVAYAATFELSRPVDPARASGLLWYDLVNRGNPVEPGAGAVRPWAYGHVHLVSGWQGDLASTATNLTVEVPTARNPDGSPITGPVLARLADSKPGTRSRALAMLANAIPYDAATLDTAKARLIAKSSETRAGVNGQTREVAAGDWAFADCTATPFPGVPDPRMLCLREGFDPSILYELGYEAKDPKVLGVGLAAMRDVASFFRYEAADRDGNPNPVAGLVRRAVAQGISQSGNALKTFLLQGFNADEAGRVVFDGMNPHIAGRLTSVNVRFGLPSGSGTLYEPGGEGVLWWARYRDAARGRPEASLLDRCTPSRTCPRIFETFGASEFNARLMTAALTGTDGRADLPLPETVRRYYLPGTTHGGALTSGFSAKPSPAPGCTLAANPNPETETMSALQRALADWVMADKEPPASAYPRMADGTLVPATKEAMGFPDLPGRPTPTGMAVGLMDYDFGPDLAMNDFRGVITRQPPAIRGTVPAMMPPVDAGGNETSGVPSVLHQAPLGTYTGWNVVASGFFAGQPCGGGLTGGFIPFAATRAARETARDPRPSLAERYGTRAGYLCAVRAAAVREATRGFLLPQDAERLVREAEAGDALAGVPQETQDAAVAGALCAR